MSRIGKKQILLPAGVTVETVDGMIVVKGSRGELRLKINPSVKVTVLTDRLNLTAEKSDRVARANWGTTRQLLANMIAGVERSWSKTLEIVGTGYRASLEGEKLILSVGFSHTLEVAPPSGITFTVVENKITVLGSDKDLVGRIAAKIHQLRPPDDYKGKGVRFQGERLKLKPGKAAKVGVGAAGGKA